MTVLKRRSRMVSFRLSEEEYEGLKHICIAVGARSLSDVARDAVQRLLESGSSPRKDLNAEFEVLTGRMEVLDREVKRLAHLLDQMPAGRLSFETARSS